MSPAARKPARRPARKPAGKITGKIAGKVVRARATFFSSPAQFRAWLAANHATATELLVGFHKRKTGKPSLTWSESVDEALAFGWIDGVRRRIDDERYEIRFSPRKPTSMWSAVNIAKIAELERAGRMTPAGRAAFARRKPDDPGYSYETRPHALPRAYRAVLDANARAAAHFDARPPSYRRAAIWWIVSAKTEDTRARRLAQLVEYHARGATIPPLTRPAKR